MSGIPEQPLDLEAVRSSYDRVADNYRAMGVGDLGPTPWLPLFARSLVPGGRVLLGPHVGDGVVDRTEAYGGVPVSWTTHLWQPEQLAPLVGEAGLEPVAEVRLPSTQSGQPQVLLAARRTH